MRPSYWTLRQYGGFLFSYYSLEPSLCGLKQKSIYIINMHALLQVNTTKTIIFGLPARFSKHFVRHRKMSVKVRGKK